MTYGYTFQYDSPVNDSFWVIFGGLYLLVLLIGVVLNIAIYVMRSISIHTIAKRRGLGNPWLVWLPVGFEWIIGSVSDQYQYVVEGEVKNERKLLLGLSVGNGALQFAAFVLSVVMLSRLIIAGDRISDGQMASIIMGPMLSVMLLGFVIAVLSIVLMVFKYICMYDLYRSCDPNNAVAYLVLGILFGILEPIFLLIVRKKDNGMPPRKDVPPVQPQPVQEPWLEQ